MSETARTIVAPVAAGWVLLEETPGRRGRYPFRLLAGPFPGKADAERERRLTLIHSVTEETEIHA